MFVEQYIWFGIQGLKADLCLLPQSNPKGTAIFAELLVKLNTTPGHLHFDDYCYRREVVGSKHWLHRTTGNTSRDKELTATWAIEYDNARYTSITAYTIFAQIQRKVAQSRMTIHGWTSDSEWNVRDRRR